MDTRDVVATLQQSQPAGSDASGRELRPDQGLDAASGAYGQVVRFLDWLLRIFPA